MTDLQAKYEYYRARLDAAMSARGVTNAILSDRTGAHIVTIAKLRSGKTRLDDEWRDRTARALNMPPDILFGAVPLPAPQPGDIVAKRKRARLQRPANDGARPELPVYGLAAGSLTGAMQQTSQEITWVPAPPALQNVIGAYVLETTGQSMVPRFFPKEWLYIHPHQEVSPGDHVVIQTRTHDNAATETWVKRFDRRTKDEIHVTQYNPSAEMVFKRRYVTYMHRILPINELF